MSTVAFVAGATGFVGRSVVAVLCARGLRTIAHVRPDSRELDKWRDRFAGGGAEVSTAPWEAAAMAEELQRLHVTHVFCLVGTTRKRKESSGDPAHETYEAVDYGLTRLLAEAAREAGTVQRFVYLSSVGASDHAKGAYLQARWKAEQAVRRSGVPWTIARPSIITGERDESRPLEAWAATLLDAALIVPGALGAPEVRARYRSTDGQTLAEALVRAAFDPATEHHELEGDALR